MLKKEFKNLPYMLYADDSGRIYNHPYYRMLGASGNSSVIVNKDDLISVPEFSKLFFIPECPPIGLDPSSGEYKVVSEMNIDNTRIKCNAVAVFLEPGYVRSYLSAVDYRLKSYTLPSWAYTAIGFKDDEYWAAGFCVEYNHKWDPRNYDDRDLAPAIEKYRKMRCSGSLVDHLINCAEKNHCFAAKNLFLRRWEAPLPVSRHCNAACLGCLSLQPDSSCNASHDRISFAPSKEEIVEIAVEHLTKAEDAIVSFGQGCEGEPLTEFGLISDSIKEIRKRTGRGTINLNTNGSWPERIREIAEGGLDSIRISINSPRREFYNLYYRPKHYDFNDVVSSIALSKSLGLYTMVNYLVFPGISDQEAEIDALRVLIGETGVNFIHLKNLCIDPQVYLKKMPKTKSTALGMKKLVNILETEFPEIRLGYFNQPVR